MRENAFIRNVLRVSGTPPYAILYASLLYRSLYTRRARPRDRMTHTYVRTEHVRNIFTCTYKKTAPAAVRSWYIDIRYIYVRARALLRNI